MKFQRGFYKQVFWKQAGKVASFRRGGGGEGAGGARSPGETTSLVVALRPVALHLREPFVALRRIITDRGTFLGNICLITEDMFIIIALPELSWSASIRRL